MKTLIERLRRTSMEHIMLHDASIIGGSFADADIFKKSSILMLEAAIKLESYLILDQVDNK